MKQLFRFTSLVCLFFFVVSCNAFMLGFTQSKAENNYYLLSKNKFGNNRFKYVSKFYKSPYLSKLLAEKGKPDFAYEYKIDKKYTGIRLYYSQLDSVFVLETGINCPCLDWKESRKMDLYERQTYSRLKGK